MKQEGHCEPYIACLLPKLHRRRKRFPWFSKLEFSSLQRGITSVLCPWWPPGWSPISGSTLWGKNSLLLAAVGNDKCPHIIKNNIWGYFWLLLIFVFLFNSVSSSTLSFNPAFHYPRSQEKWMRFLTETSNHAFPIILSKNTARSRSYRLASATDNGAVRLAQRKSMSRAYVWS